MKNSSLYYSVGALLYCPANNLSVANSLIQEKFGTNFSLALCLEDTINDNAVTKAEQILINSIDTIYRSLQSNSFYLPKIFIRVRTPEQICRLTTSFGASLEIIRGFIIPKFSSHNATEYIHEIAKANEISSHTLYMMPIYENSTIIDLRNRTDILYSLKDKLDNISDCVLNIRVGGNDLCHMFGFRRHSNESIHKIKSIANIFSDIITIYGMDYVVSGPVWEYYSGTNWDQGLIKEIKDDKLCGFTGKTVIHPNQIAIVNQSYQVARSDFDDAKSILNWNKQKDSFVSGSFAKNRMNEYKTHNNWAQQILYLAEAYGIQD